MEIAEVVDQESLKYYLAGLPQVEQMETAAYLDFCCTFWRVPEIIRDFYLSKEKNPDTILFSGMQMLQSNLSRPIGQERLGGNDVNRTALDFLSAVYQVSNGSKYQDARNQKLDVIVSSIVWNIRNRGPHIWQSVGAELELCRNYSPREFLPSEIPKATERSFSELKRALLFHNDGWGVWVQWFERLLEQKSIHADKLIPKLGHLTAVELNLPAQEFNSLFDDLLESYWSEGKGDFDENSLHSTSTHHIKTIRLQVSALSEFLDVEYLKLSGLNARSPEQVDVLELLRDLKALVDKLMERLYGVEDDSKAIATVQESLPAVVEKAGELAIIETKPQASETVMIMSATIKSLTDAGADQKLATQFAISEAAAKKLSPGWRRLFPWSKKSGEEE